MSTPFLNELSALADNEKKTYLNFWKNFGAVIKEGLYEFNDHHDKILPLLRFENSKDTNLISLDKTINLIHIDINKK